MMMMRRITNKAISIQVHTHTTTNLYFTRQRFLPRRRMHEQTHTTTNLYFTRQRFLPRSRMDHE